MTTANAHPLQWRVFARQTIRALIPTGWWSTLMSSETRTPLPTSDLSRPLRQIEPVEVPVTPPLPQAGKTFSALTTSAMALPAELLNRTKVLPPTKEAWWERIVVTFGLPGLARRSRDCRRAWTLFLRVPEFDMVITDGALVGLTFAFLQSLRPSRRTVHVMYDCYWYGGGRFRRGIMRFCLRQVDLCVVWTRVECLRYAGTYNVSLSRFAFVRHHHTLNRYQFEVGDDGYIFAGGNSDRDYKLFCDAVGNLPISCVLATNLPATLAGVRVPPNVHVVNASAVEFRQLMARARIVVLPMRANMLRTGGQQTFLNAMHMGKPVVLVDPEGGVDYIDHGKTGLLVPFGDAAALHNAIRYLWEHPEEAHAIGQRSREVAVPLTTERCNMEIWRLALRLVHKRQIRTTEGAGESSFP